MNKSSEFVLSLNICLLPTIMSSVRKCSNCGIADGHNCRTCPLNLAPSPASVATTFWENHAAPKWFLQNETTAATVPAEEVECPICKEPIGKTNCFTTDCGHKFCGECILIHSQINNKCPLCRAELAGASDVDWKEKYDELHQHALDIEEKNEDYRDVFQQQEEIIRQINEERETLRREIAELKLQNDFQENPIWSSPAESEDDDDEDDDDDDEDDDDEAPLSELMAAAGEIMGGQGDA